MATPGAPGGGRWRGGERGTRRPAQQGRRTATDQAGRAAKPPDGDGQHMAAGVAGSRRRTGPRRPAREKAHTQPWAAPLGKSPFRVRRPRARTQPSPQSEPARPGTSSRRPEQTGPDQTGPDRTGPERTGPDQSGPDRTRPDRTGPDRAGPDRNRTRPDRTRPDRTRPDRTRPDQTGPERTGPDQTGPDQTGPDRTGPERTGPERTGPERTGPDQTGQASPRPACPATRRKRLRTALGCPAADHFRGETKMIGWPTRTARAGPDRRTRTERPAQDSRGRAGPTGARKKARRTWRAFRVLFGGSLRIWRQSARKR